MDIQFNVKANEYDRILAGNYALASNGTEFYNDSNKVKLALIFNGSSYYIESTIGYTSIGKLRVKKINSPGCIELQPYSNEFNTIVLYRINEDKDQFVKECQNKLTSIANDLNNMDEPDIIELIRSNFDNITIKTDMSGNYEHAEIILTGGGPTIWIDTEKSNLYYTHGNFKELRAIHSDIINWIDEYLYNYLNE